MKSSAARPCLSGALASAAALLVAAMLFSGSAKASERPTLTGAEGALGMPAENKNGEPVTLQLRWHHQFQFAGYYAAKEKGFYREAGLDVTILAGSPDRQPVNEVMAGRAHYGTANSELLYERLKGQPLVAMASIFQHSASVFLVRQSSGILSPQDLVGRKVMSVRKEDDIGLLAMLRNEGIDPGDVALQNSSYDIMDLVGGKTDAFNAYLTNEPYVLANLGIPFTIINPAAYGIDFYSDILFTSEAELRQHPARVSRFREATLKGWNYAMHNREEIIGVIQNQYNSDRTEDHLRFEANAMVPLMMPDLIELGHMNPGRWKHMGDTLVSHGLAPPDYSLDGFLYNPVAAPDLRKWLWLVAGLVSALVLVGGGAGFAVVFNTKLKSEIAERIHVEDQLRNAYEVVDRANEAKSDFLASMSHDLRTPLNAILGLSSIMKDQTFGPLGNTRYDEYADHIHSSGSFLLSLVNDVLDLSKIESGGYELRDETLDVAAVVQLSIEQVSRTTGSVEDAMARILVEVPEDLPAMRGDEQVLTRILNNLLSNAIKFTPSGGTVSVTGLPESDGSLTLSVTDTGRGMSSADIIRALTPFEQTSTAGSENYEGTGLGLALCDNFMQLFGGSLVIESELDKGTIVKINFPAERLV